MMREIEFRAWDGELMYNVDTITFPLGGVEWYGTGVGHGYSEANPKYDWKVDSVLMQYTGLKDKNGVKIFEGDIIKRFGVTILVKFDIHNDDYDSYYGYNNYPDDACCEVIGNIYQNPELLSEVNDENK